MSCRVFFTSRRVRQLYTLLLPPWLLTARRRGLSSLASPSSRTKVSRQNAQWINQASSHLHASMELSWADSSSLACQPTLSSGKMMLPERVQRGQPSQTTTISTSLQAQDSSTFHLRSLIMLLHKAAATGQPLRKLHQSHCHLYLSIQLTRALSKRGPSSKFLGQNPPTSNLLPREAKSRKNPRFQSRS